MKTEQKAPVNYEVKLMLHVTDGGARYLTDSHDFKDATIIIRLDGGTELTRCQVN